MKSVFFKILNQIVMIFFEFWMGLLIPKVVPEGPRAFLGVLIPKVVPEGLRTNI